eukprot:scaffold10949_cov67-Phaeocystis_antarctica.AAC.2
MHTCLFGALGCLGASSLDTLVRGESDCERRAHAHQSGRAYNFAFTHTCPSTEHHQHQVNIKFQITVQSVTHHRTIRSAIEQGRVRYTTPPPWPIHRRRA